MSRKEVPITSQILIDTGSRIIGPVLRCFNDKNGPISSLFIFVHDNGNLNVLSMTKCGHTAMSYYFGIQLPMQT